MAGWRPRHDCLTGSPFERGTTWRSRPRSAGRGHCPGSMSPVRYLAGRWEPMPAGKRRTGLSRTWPPQPALARRLAHGPATHPRAYRRCRGPLQTDCALPGRPVEFPWPASRARAQWWRSGPDAPPSWSFAARSGRCQAPLSRWSSRRASRPGTAAPARALFPAHRAVHVRSRVV